MLGVAARLGAYDAPMANPRRLEYVDIDEVEGAPRNPKGHDLELLDGSFDEFGFAEPPLRDERTGRLVAGHGRLEQLRARRDAGEPAPEGILVRRDGRWLLPVVTGWSSRDDAHAEGYLLVSNRATEAGGWVPEELAEMLSDLAVSDVPLDAVGFSHADLDELLASLAPADEDPVDEPEGPTRISPPDEPVTRPGDVWQLGPHRIMCGSCRDADAVAVLLDGQAVTVAFTSPPYAAQRSYDPDSGFEEIPPDDYVEWYQPVADNIAAHLAPDGSYFLNIKEAADDGVRQRYVLDLFVAHLDQGWRYVDEFVWPRIGFPIDPRNAQRFKNGWEPVMHYTRQRRHKFHPEAVMVQSDNSFTYDPERKLQGTKETGFLDVGRDGTVPGLVFPSNILPNFGVAGSGTDHPAAFPVGLPAWFIRSHSDEGDAVFDPFVGSGSTVLAAHQLDRVGYGMELSAGYTDMLLERLQLATGLVPERVSDGRVLNFLD